MTNEYTDWAESTFDDDEIQDEGETIVFQYDNGMWSGAEGEYRTFSDAMDSVAEFNLIDWDGVGIREILDLSEKFAESNPYELAEEIANFCYPEASEGALGDLADAVSRLEEERPDIVFLRESLLSNAEDILKSMVRFRKIEEKQPTSEVEFTFDPFVDPSSDDCVDLSCLLSEYFENEEADEDERVDLLEHLEDYETRTVLRDLRTLEQEAPGDELFGAIMIEFNRILAIHKKPAIEVGKSDRTLAASC